MELALYPWQKACLASWFDHQCHGIVQVVTGAGKTLMALSAAKELALKSNTSLKVKIVVPKAFMVSQWTSCLLDNGETFGVFRNEIGCYFGGHKDRPDRKYMIYVVNSARYSLSRHILEDFQKGDAVLLIADECHHYASAENRRIFEFMSLSSEEKPQAYYSLGLSATPQAHGFSEILVPALGPVIYTYGFSEAIKSRVINNCALYHIGLYFTAKESEKYEKLTFGIGKSLADSKKFKKNLMREKDPDFFATIRKLANDPDPAVSGWAIHLLGLIYRRRALVCEASARIACAEVLVSRLDAKAKIIIFGERINQCDILYEKLAKSYPHQVARYHSGMGCIAKKNAISRYRDGEVRILICCRALDEGFDIPSADVGIVLSGTSTERQRIQRLGRILRRSGSKTISSLYYFYLEGTLEDSTLLPHAIEDAQEFDVSYHESDGNFTHSLYDRLACRIVEKLSQKKLAAETLTVTKYFLHLGQVRSDWLLDEEVLKERLDSSATNAEYNYWACMISVSREKSRGTGMVDSIAGRNAK